MGNLAFNVPNVATAAGSILTTIAALVAPDAQAIAGAGAILLLIAGLSTPFVREIDADDASVFLGLARVAGSDRTAVLAEIVAATNVARNEGHLRLGVLTEEQVLHSLSVLSQMGSVTPAGDQGEHWQVIEEHGAL
jgi:predicted secreted protein